MTSEILEITITLPAGAQIEIYLRSIVKRWERDAYPQAQNLYRPGYVPPRAASQLAPASDQPA